MILRITCLKRRCAAVTSYFRGRQTLIHWPVSPPATPWLLASQLSMNESMWLDGFDHVTNVCLNKETDLQKKKKVLPQESKEIKAPITLFRICLETFWKDTKTDSVFRCTAGIAKHRTCSRLKLYLKRFNFMNCRIQMVTPEIPRRVYTGGDVHPKWSSTWSVTRSLSVISGALFADKYIVVLSGGNNMRKLCHLRTVKTKEISKSSKMFCHAFHTSFECIFFYVDTLFYFYKKIFFEKEVD